MTTALGGMFPAHAVLRNQIAKNSFVMSLVQRKDIVIPSEAFETFMECPIKNALLLKGLQVRFLDGNPAQDEILTLEMDGEKVLHGEPVAKFIDQEPAMDLSAMPVCLFPAESMDGIRIGIMMANGTWIKVKVKTKRGMEIRMVMAEYGYKEK